MSIEKFKEMVENSKNIVFFGGAGVSTESNIPDFRSETGLYSERDKLDYPPEYLLSRTFFDRETEKFFDFYRNNMVHKEAMPNDAHYVLSQLEREGKVKGVITQNIDGLHQKAGSEKVYELHGSIERNYCMDCNTFYDLDFVMLKEGIPRCNHCGGIVKPDVVLYEEALDMSVMQEALDLISRADVFIIGGTSLTVNPAASLVNYYNGNKLVIINQSPTPYDNRAGLMFQESIGKVMKSLV